MCVGLYGHAMGIPWEDASAALFIAFRIMHGTEAMDFDIDPRGKLPTAAQRRVEEMVHSQMEFTFGHEFAHLFQGHMADPSLTAPPGSTSVEAADPQEARDRSHAFEYEADRCAVHNVTTGRAARARIAEAGLRAMLQIHLLETMTELAGLHLQQPGTTHPPAKMRLVALHDSVKSLVSASRGEVDSLIDEIEALARELVNDPDFSQMTEFYGSIYYPSFHGKPTRDRIDY